MCSGPWNYHLYPTASDKRWPRLWAASSSGVIYCVGSLIRWLMRQHKVSTINLISAQGLLQKIHDARSRSIVSVMNHSGTWDDLCVTCLLATSKRQLSDPNYMRLTPVAADICYVNPLVSRFFSLGNCVPAHRTLRNPETGEVTLEGRGVYQESFNFLVNELNRGGRWVNILPQGRVIIGKDKLREPEIRFRWGVGRLIADVSPTPLVLPIWHEGIDTLNPEASSAFQYLWRGLRSIWESRATGGHRVTINFGEPLDLSEMVRELRARGFSPEDLRAAITERIQARMMQLRAETIRIHASDEGGDAGQGSGWTV